MGFCQWTKRFDPNTGVFISGDDLYTRQAPFCRCGNGAGGKVNNGKGGKVKVIIECAFV